VYSLRRHDRFEEAAMTKFTDSQLVGLVVLVGAGVVEALFILPWMSWLFLHGEIQFWVLLSPVLMYVVAVVEWALLMETKP